MTSSRLTSLRCILILSSYLYLCVPSSHFSWNLSTTIRKCPFSKTSH
jgi:hypothetical protein